MSIPLKSYTFYGETYGKRLLVFGAIHGDETCGTEGCYRVIKRLEQGDLKLKSGQVTFVPICNPAAYEKRIRYVDYNLNRIFQPHPEAEQQKSAEKYYATLLTHYVCNTDYLLDLHSISSKGEAFAFQDFITHDSTNFSSSLGISPILQGWPNIYNDANRSEDWTTQQYANPVGVTGVTVECGSHLDKNSIDVAERSIYRAMAGLQIIEPVVDVSLKDKVQKIQMHSFQVKEKDGEFIKNWANMDKVEVGDIIARYSDGEVLTSPISGFLIMPFSAAKIGEEWYYLGLDI